MQDGSVMVPPGYDQSAAAAGAGQGQASQDAFQQPDQAQFEADKRAVYKHPLFPLLALLFERCEQATQSAECPNSDSFNMDIQAFVQHQERDRKPFLMNDPEVDGLMIKAIQVLRIHLLELEKVQELCKDFCNRYITCLKGKMQSENLLRSDYASGYEHNNNNSSCHSSESSSPPGQHSSYPTSPAPHAHALAGHLTPASPHPAQVVSSTGGGSGSGGSNGGSGCPQQQQQQQHQQHFAGAGAGSGDLLGSNMVGGPGPGPGSGSSCAGSGQGLSLGVGAGPGPGASYALALTPPLPLTLPPGSPQPPHQHQLQLQHQPLGSVSPHAPSSPGFIHGSTPLSQIGANPFPPPTENSLGSLGHGNLSPSPSPGSAEDDDDFLGRGKKQKRGVLPKHATSIMRSWLFQHLVHPYPTEDEKRTIAAQTNLTLLQVNNWFINARRRILQPMLDASNTGDSTGSNNTNQGRGKSTNNRKGKSSSKDCARNAAAQRFWPETMAGAALPHLLAQDHNGGGGDHGDSTFFSSGGEESDVEGENDGDGGWSQDEDGDNGVEDNVDDVMTRSVHHRLKSEPSSDSEQ